MLKDDFTEGRDIRISGLDLRPLGLGFVKELMEQHEAGREEYPKSLLFVDHCLMMGGQFRVLQEVDNISGEISCVLIEEDGDAPTATCKATYIQI